MFDLACGKEGPDLGTFGTCCSQSLQGCLNLRRHNLGPEGKFKMLLCRAIGCPWPVASLLRSKRYCGLNE